MVINSLDSCFKKHENVAILKLVNVTIFDVVIDC